MESRTRVADEPALTEELPATWALLRAGNLVVHDRVSMVSLHGSRGPRGGARPDSDLDLALVVRPPYPPDAKEFAALLREVINTTLRNWRGPVELDLAAVFDKTGCGLPCFEGPREPATPNCLGVYKLQKGFDGFVAETDCRAMHPLVVIWRRARASPTAPVTAVGLSVGPDQLRPNAHIIPSAVSEKLK